MAFQAKLREVLQPRPNGNFEFSWINARYNGNDILGEVRQQEGGTCVFEAFCAGAEMAVRRDEASKNRSCDIKFDSTSLVRDYEEHTGRKLCEESPSNLPSNIRQETVSQLFWKNGVLATSANWEGQQRIKLTRYIKQRSPKFDRIADFIRDGKAVVGCIPVDEQFKELEPEQIYHFPAEDESKPIDFSHFVLFVGYGYEGGPHGNMYLIFMNSHGTEFGDKGFGRVYFSDTFNDCFYVLSAKASPEPAQHPGTSTSSAANTATELPIEESADRPAQRRRLGSGRGGSNTDGVGSSSLAVQHTAPDAGSHGD